MGYFWNISNVNSLLELFLQKWQSFQQKFRLKISKEWIFFNMHRQSSVRQVYFPWSSSQNHERDKSVSADSLIYCSFRLKGTEHGLSQFLSVSLWNLKAHLFGASIMHETTFKFLGYTCYYYHSKFVKERKRNVVRWHFLPSANMNLLT